MMLHSSTTELHSAISSLVSCTNNLDKNMKDLRSDLSQVTESSTTALTSSQIYGLEAFHQRLLSHCAQQSLHINHILSDTEDGNQTSSRPTSATLVKAAEAALFHFQAQSESLKQVLIDQGIPDMQDLDVKLQPIPSIQQCSTPKLPSHPVKRRCDVLSPWTPRTAPPQPDFTNGFAKSTDNHHIKEALATNELDKLADLDDMLDTMTLEDLGLSSLSRDLIEDKRFVSETNLNHYSTPTTYSSLPSVHTASQSKTQLQSPLIPQISGSHFDGLETSFNPSIIPQKSGSMPKNFTLRGLSDAEFKLLEPFWRCQITHQFVEDTISEINELAVDKRMMSGGVMQPEADRFTLAELTRSSQMDSTKLNDVLLALLQINRIRLVKAGTTFDDQCYGFAESQ